jgi:dimethylargininase
VLTAITRQVSPSLVRCELSYLDRQEIDIGRAIEQHRTYERSLAGLGVKVLTLPAEPQLPDSVFVEDAAIVLDELAVMTRMGATSRRDEPELLARSLRDFRILKWIREPGTLEGGDVMRLGRTLYAGLTKRTNIEGIRQLGELIAPFGYQVVAVEVTGCLHLKSAGCPLGEDTILVNRQWFDTTALDSFRLLDVPENEPWAANVLQIGDAVLVQTVCPTTADLLEKAGYLVQPIDTSELAKAEAGLTCMSLLFENNQRPPSSARSI